MTSPKTSPLEPTTKKGTAPPVRAARKAQKQAAFLDAYRLCGNLTVAGRMTGIDRKLHHDWVKEEKYAAAYAEASDHAVDLLEAEARRRAVQGVKRPVYQGGKQVGSIQDYSDTLLIFLLKGVRPDKYRERVSIDANVKHEEVKDNLDAEIDTLLGRLGELDKLGESAPAVAPESTA